MFTEANKKRTKQAQNRKEYALGHIYDKTGSEIASDLGLSIRQVRRYTQPTNAYKRRLEQERAFATHYIQQGLSCSEVVKIADCTPRQFYYWKALLNKSLT